MIIPYPRVYKGRNGNRSQSLQMKQVLEHRLVYGISKEKMKYDTSLLHQKYIRFRYTYGSSCQLYENKNNLKCSRSTLGSIIIIIILLGSSNGQDRAREMQNCKGGCHHLIAHTV